MKQCTKCHQWKPIDQFYRQAVNSKDGFQSHCKTCDNARVAARKARNPERTKQIQARSDRAKYDKYKFEIRARNTAWKLNNKDKMQAADGRRRASKMQRTPLWLTADDLWMIGQAYELAALRTKLFGFGWHVDHIIPLQGKRVSGLHTPNNLQVIPAQDNMRKSNSFTNF